MDKARGVSAPHRTRDSWAAGLGWSRRELFWVPTGPQILWASLFLPPAVGSGLCHSGPWACFILLCIGPLALAQPDSLSPLLPGRPERGTLIGPQSPALPPPWDALQASVCLDKSAGAVGGARGPPGQRDPQKGAQPKPAGWVPRSPLAVRAEASALTREAGWAGAGGLSSADGRWGLGQPAPPLCACCLLCTARS